MKITASVARRVHRSTNPGFWAHLEQRRKEKAGERNLSPRLKGGVPEPINAGKKKREPHKSEVRALGAAACRLKSVDKKDTRYKARAQKTAHPTKMRCASWERQLAAGGPKGIRTLDLSDANRTLSQLSYGPIKAALFQSSFYILAQGWAIVKRFYEFFAALVRSWNRSMCSHFPR